MANNAILLLLEMIRLLASGHARPIGKGCLLKEMRRVGSQRRGREGDGTGGRAGESVGERGDGGEGGEERVREREGRKRGESGGEREGRGGERRSSG